MNPKTKAAIAWIFLSIAGLMAGSIIQSLVDHSSHQILQDALNSIIYSPLILISGLPHAFPYLKPLHWGCLIGGFPLWGISCIGIHKKPRIHAVLAIFSAGLLGFLNSYVLWTMMGV